MFSLALLDSRASAVDGQVEFPKCKDNCELFCKSAKAIRKLEQGGFVVNESSTIRFIRSDDRAVRCESNARFRFSSVGTNH